jgi:hypothetical protein
LYPHMTDIDYQKFIDETYGSIPDETFFPELFQNEEQAGS